MILQLLDLDLIPIQLFIFLVDYKFFLNDELFFTILVYSDESTASLISSGKQRFDMTCFRFVGIVSTLGFIIRIGRSVLPIFNTFYFFFGVFDLLLQFVSLLLKNPLEIFELFGLFIVVLDDTLLGEKDEAIDLKVALELFDEIADVIRHVLI